MAVCTTLTPTFDLLNKKMAHLGNIHIEFGLLCLFVLELKAFSGHTETEAWTKTTMWSIRMVGQ